MQKRFLMGLLIALAGMQTHALDIGEKAPELSFKDIRYLPRTLADLKTEKAYVLFFFTNTCPVAQRYLPRMEEIHKAYQDKGVTVVGINASPGDTIRDVAWLGLEYDLSFPLVSDMDGSCCASLGITRTPEVAVLDADRVLLYRGRIDDQYRLGGVKPVIGREDLKIALDEILAGSDVSEPATQAEGCAITYPPLSKPDHPLTYSEDIAPIMNQHCVTCHRPGGGAPFGLNTFKKVAHRADMIAEVTGEERMPPWYAHPEFGTFSNDRRLSREEKLTLAQWVAGDRAEGDPALLPEPPVFSDSEWSFEPDVVIKAAQPNALPPTGFIPYRYVLLPFTFEQDTYVDGIEIKSSNPRVMHHSNLFYTPGGLQFTRSQNFVTGTVPGGLPTILEEGRAIVIPKGVTLGLQIHYVTTGKAEMDTPMVALRYCKEPVRKITHYKIIDREKLEIPPFVPNYPVKAVETIEEDSSMVAFFAHMHLRGKDMTFYAHYPDGSDEVLMSIPNFNFDWQLSYLVPEGQLKIPAGTKIEALAHFDNSAFNPYNPAPEKTIHYGPQTVDEMMQGFVFYTHDAENLSVQIDPKTGWVVQEVARAAE